MNKIIKTNCRVGSVEQTQEQIDLDIVAAKKAEINESTEAKIFKALGVETKEQALIAQITKLSRAVAFLATKIDKSTLSEAENAEIEIQLKDFDGIKKILVKGKEAKAKL